MHAHLKTRKDSLDQSYSSIGTPYQDSQQEHNPEPRQVPFPIHCKAVWRFPALWPYRRSRRWPTRRHQIRASSQRAYPSVVPAFPGTYKLPVWRVLLEGLSWFHRSTLTGELKGRYQIHSILMMNPFVFSVTRALCLVISLGGEDGIKMARVELVADGGARLHNWSNGLGSIRANPAVYS